MKASTWNSDALLAVRAGTVISWASESGFSQGRDEMPACPGSSPPPSSWTTSLTLR